jgi:hypothetical protein
VLITQVHVLNIVFNRSLQKAQEQTQFKGLDIYMKQGLKAQAQCRATIEAIAALRNPMPSVVKQTNIANGPQQVNNGGRIDEQSKPEQGCAELAAVEQSNGATLSSWEKEGSTEQSEAWAVHERGNR